MSEINIESMRSILKNQYHAALAMLGESIERCPEDVWFSTEHQNAFWQIAYHVLFFTHLYLQPNEAAFRPWEHHQGNDQDPDAFTRPYTKTEVLEYWALCEQMLDSAVDALDLQSPESGFSWYKVSKLEHQIINIRHIQGHTAQLADRLRASNGIGIRWVGSRKSAP